MKLLHFADVHFDQQNADRALASLAVVAETGRRERVDAFLLAGDLFNRGIINSAAARMPDLLRAIAIMLDIAPIFAVSGTPTHDVAGCYMPLQRLAGSHEFVLLGPGKSVILEVEDEKLLLVCLPEPSKTWLLAGQNGMSAEKAAAAVKVELRKVLLGMGAVRAEHPKIPAVMLYHGAVEGATLANGQLLEGGIALGREDLALVGADYYAMGHVHLAQQIPGLPAYYSGSAFPVDWGELDQKGCNLVEITWGGPAPATWDGEATTVGFFPFVTEITRIPFPHAPRKKIVVTWPDRRVTESVQGFDVWMAIKTPATEKPNVDEANIWLIAAGAGPGSRMTVDTIPTETVRAAEITERKHLREKVAVYAEASGEQAPAESVLAKADALEREAVEGAPDDGAHLRIRKLRLRGATGIWKGLGLDEITLDLDRYDAGLIALVGPNGAGKSTLLENMHPWPCLLTREGKLQDHFRLRDSARELWFTDERDGAEYRALMLVDGVNSTGKAEYHLFRGDVPLTNGRKEDYEAAIEKLFGSLALFLRSAFVSQRATKNNPDLAEATKGEKKAIFRELAGLGWMQAAAEGAKDNAEVIEHLIEIDQAKVSAQAQQLEALPELRAKLERTGVELGKQQTELVALEAEGKKLAEEAKALAAQKEQQREQEALENERVKKHAEQVARIQSDYSNALRAHRDHEAKVHASVEAAQKTVSDLEVRKARLLSTVDSLTEALAQPDKACPQCGYIDPELKERREARQQNLETMQQQALDADLELVAAKRRVDESMAKHLAPPEQPKLPTFDDSQRAQIDKALDGKIAKAQAALEDARQQYIAANEIRATLRSQVDLYRQRIAELEELRAEIEEIRNVAEKQRAEAAEWRWLERACGADGIQALELDALGPGIAEVANRLLSVAYGTRFTVEFRTTRIAGRGSKVKQVEDFSIWIHDSERESEQDLSTLSGGESVWIKRALYDAFAIIRDRNTGLKFLTAFQDEADGALDPEARQAYFAMLRAAHAESGRRHTIIITHSQDAQEQIPQRIVMAELAGVMT